MAKQPNHGVGAWLRWEFGRRIEVTAFIKVIIAERFIKGSLLIIGGFVLLFASQGSALDNLVQNVQEQINFNPTHHGLWSGIINALILKFGKLSDATQVAISVGAMLYGALEILEGVGLCMRRRWAEYLVLIATVTFLPLELDEVIRRATGFKAGALILNLAIAGYLVWRKRLFLEREASEI